MAKKHSYFSFVCFFAFTIFTSCFAQSKRVYSSNQLSFQYGFSLKALVEFTLSKSKQKPVYRVCADFGIGSNLLARELYFSINNEIQIYNGGFGSKRRAGSTKPAVKVDFINAFTLTSGVNNYFTSDSIPAIQSTNRSVPLYYFSNFAYPALQNPYNYSVSAGTVFVHSFDQLTSNQRLGFLNLHLNRVQLSYYNDGGAPFDETYLGDSKDRYYSGGALFTYKGNPVTSLNLVELSFSKYTGYTKNAFEISNKLDLAFVDYNNPEEKYYNKSLWSLNVSDPEKGIGININRYNYTDWDIQHLIHFSIYNSFHLVPYDDYFSISGIYYHNYTNIGLR